MRGNVLEVTTSGISLRTVGVKPRPTLGGWGVGVAVATNLPSDH